MILFKIEKKVKLKNGELKEWVVREVIDETKKQALGGPVDAIGMVKNIAWTKLQKFLSENEDADIEDQKKDFKVSEIVRFEKNEAITLNSKHEVIKKIRVDENDNETVVWEKQDEKES